MIQKLMYIFALLFLPMTAFGQKLPHLPKNKFHLYLLVGQSNMAGRGKIDSIGNESHAKVFMLNKQNEWVIASDPMHFDKPSAGVGLGLTFGKIMAAQDISVYIGLIPCAVGGSSIEAWNPDSIHYQTNTYPWNDMVKRTKIAMEKGTLKGILWHQGEADSKKEKKTNYQARLLDLITRMRKIFNNKKLPFVAGTLGDCWVEWNKDGLVINQIINDLPNKTNLVTVVNTSGLPCAEDRTHFTTEALRQLGKRYAEAFLKLQSK